MHKLEIKQRIMQAPWPLVLAAMLLISQILVYLILNTKEVSFDKEFIGILLSSLFSAVVVFLVMNISSHIVLESDKVSFKNSPLSKSLTYIALEEIESWKIIDYKFGFKRGLGFKRDLRGNKYFVMKYGKALELQLKAGKKVTLGIENADLTNRFIRDNWETESNYG